MSKWKFLIAVSTAALLLLVPVTKLNDIEAKEPSIRETSTTVEKKLHALAHSSVVSSWSMEFFDFHQDATFEIKVKQTEPAKGPNILASATGEGYFASGEKEGTLNVKRASWSEWNHDGDFPENAQARGEAHIVSSETLPFRAELISNGYPKSETPDEVRLWLDRNANGSFEDTEIVGNFEGELHHSSATGQGEFENEYAEVNLNMGISKRKLTKEEGFHVTLDLVATVKKVPEKYQELLAYVSELILNYDVMLQSEKGKQITMDSGKVTEAIPELKKGATLEFHERIPSAGNLSFPQESSCGSYTLYLKMSSVEAKAFSMTMDVTKQARNFFPERAFDPGMEIGQVCLQAMPSDVNCDGVVNGSDLDLLTQAFNSKPPDHLTADVNDDGIVDIFDLVIVGRNFGEGHE